MVLISDLHLLGMKLRQLAKIEGMKDWIAQRPEEEPIMMTGKKSMK